MDGSKERRLPDRRRSFLVHSRLQGIPALLFLLLAAAAGTAFALSFLAEARPLLRVACTKGHYCPTYSAFEVVGPLLVRRLVALYFLVLLGGTGLLVVLSSRVTAGIRRLCDSLKGSALGDLSTPTAGVRLTGLEETARRMDRGARRITLERIRALREEAAELAARPPPGEGLRRRMGELEESMRRGGEAAGGEGVVSRPAGAVPSGTRWRNRFLLRYLLLQSAGALLLLWGFHAVLRFPFPGGYAQVYGALRALEGRLPLLVTVLVLAWLVLAGIGGGLLAVLCFGRVAGPLVRAGGALDDLASGVPVRTLRFREGDAGGDLAEAVDGFVEALRKDRDACLVLLREAARAEGGEEAGREAAGAALREVATVLHRYR